MNSDIRLATNFFDHPKILVLEEQLGERGIVALLRLWCWAALHRHDGDLGGMSDSRIERAANIPDGMLSQLAATGFVDGEPGARSLHNWGARQQWAANAESRSKSAKKAADWRWKLKRASTKKDRKDKEKCGSDAGRICAPQCGSHDAPSPSPSPSPSPVPYLSPVLEAEILARNERIMREAEPQPVRFSLECLAGQIAQFTTDDLKLWSEAYPAVNVPEALNRARAWIEANPERRKTLRGAKRYLNAWLSREQNSGGDRKPANRPSPMDAIKRRFLEGRS